MVCIFPNDPSLESLSPLIDMLKQNIEVIQLDIANSIDVINIIKNLPDYSDIIFIGHGATHCIYGGIVDDQKQTFINSDNIEILKNKNIVALACRSSEFLSSQHKVLNNYLGFGNIPSAWNEVMAERDIGDIDYLNSIDEDDLEFYFNEFTQISIICLQNYLTHFSLNKLYLDYLLHINKNIYKLLLNKDRVNYKGLVELFIDTKNEIEYEIKNN